MPNLKNAQILKNDQQRTSLGGLVPIAQPQSVEAVEPEAETVEPVETVETEPVEPKGKKRTPKTDEA